MELNLKDIFHLLLKKWWIIALCMLLCGSIAGVRAYYLDPVYEATTTLYVGKNAAKEGFSYQDLNIATSVVLDYQEIAKSRIVAATAIKELTLTDFTVEDVIDKVSVSSKTDTRVIEISVMDTDPNLALVLTNKVAEVFMRKIIEIMQVENVQVIDLAEFPEDPVSPGIKTVAAIGLAIGLVIGAGIIFLMAFLDYNIKTPDDVRKHLDLPVIGTIPAFQTLRKGD